MADNVLILGSGFIGTALAKRLAIAGYSPTVVSRSISSRSAEGINWLQGHLNDPRLMEKQLSRCSAVVHAASTTTPGRNAPGPASEAEDNLLPLLRLMEVLDHHPAVPLLYLSSGGAIYGNPTTLPVTEAHPLAPLSYHAAGKAAAEHFLGVFSHQGHPISILRPSNVYGPGQPLQAGFGVVRTLLDHIQHRTPMTIWGGGETVRDYLYIDDLISACLAVLENPETGTFNVGSGRGLSLNALCDLAEEVTGCRLERCHEAARRADVREVVLDNAAFQSRYTWRPTVTIEQGIKATWEWLQERP